MTQRWRAVSDHAGYEVSDLGSVRYRGRLKSPGRNKKGYVQVSIGHSGTVLLHTLVLRAFRGPAPPGLQARHLDDDKSNNRLTNLAWGTPAENTADMMAHGRHVPRAQGNARDKLTLADVQAIRASADSSSVAAMAYGISARHVRTLRSGSWYGL